MPLQLSVSERIRYFESRRSGHIYIIGHGVLLTENATVKFKYHGRKREAEGMLVAVDTGGVGGTLKAIEYLPKSESKSAPIRKKGSLDQTKFSIPLNMSIRFYCPHGAKLDSSVANLVEGFSVGRPGLGQVVEVVAGGGLCYNYRLAYPSGLKVSVNPLRARHDVIMLSENRANAYVPLSTILEDPRCQGATIHWLACREEVSRPLDGRNEKVADKVDMNVLHYLDAVGGEPVHQYIGKSPTFTDDRQRLMDNRTWV